MSCICGRNEREVASNSHCWMHLNYSHKCVGLILRPPVSGTQQLDLFILFQPKPDTIPPLVSKLAECSWKINEGAGTMFTWNTAGQSLQENFMTNSHPKLLTFSEFISLLSPTWYLLMASSHSCIFRITSPWPSEISLCAPFSQTKVWGTHALEIALTISICSWGTPTTAPLFTLGWGSEASVEISISKTRTFSTKFSI